MLMPAIWGILTSSQFSWADNINLMDEVIDRIANSRTWLRQTPRWLAGLMEWARPIRMRLRPNQAIRLAATVGVPYPFPRKGEMRRRRTVDIR